MSIIILMFKINGIPPEGAPTSKVNSFMLPDRGFIKKIDI